MDEQSIRAASWKRLACRTARKVNCAWCVQVAGPAFAVAGAAMFALILWSRSRHGAVLPLTLVPWIATAFLAAGIVSFVLARRRFLSAADAMVRLESELLLHNALTTAAAGCGPWPAVPSPARDGWRWRWSRAVGPLLGAAAFVVLAFWLPLAPEVPAALRVVEPQSWAQIESWLDKLVEEKIVTPEAKAEQAARLDRLRDQPQDKWFSHESMNASDTLKEQLQRDIQNLGREFDQAARSLSALENYADQLSTAGKDQLLKDFDEAVSGMKTGQLDVDPDLLKQLGQIDPKNLKSLSPGQLKGLRDALKKNSDACKGMCQNPGFLGDGEGEDDELAELQGLLRKRQGDRDGDDPGNGGIDRGPGTAPLTLSDEENRFDTDKNEGAVSPDLSRAKLGATLGIKDGKHEVDKTPVTPSTAGAVQSTGEGGGQVWRESLTPEEKAVLKKTFK
ncbi:MAG: hypothetical protein K1X78_24145 [Verrucomicrobiaceae bacterium]|nr:hypothetical protein [Verrucomicrobiaceae bacterium]